MSQFLIGGDRTREFLGQPELEIPAAPTVEGALARAFRRYRLAAVYLPARDGHACPGSMAGMRDWACGGAKKSEVEHEPLPGRWVAVETVAKPHDPADEENRDEDLLMKDVASRMKGMPSNRGRFGWSYDQVVQEILPVVAEVLGVYRDMVRLPTVAEAAYAAEFFDWLRETHDEYWLPDLGRASRGPDGNDAWEWTRTRVRRSDESIALTRRARANGHRLEAAWRDSPRRLALFRPVIFL